MLSACATNTMAAGVDIPDFHETAPVSSGDGAGETPVSAGMSNFKHVNTYSDGQFADVTPEDWYSSDVGMVYELGLIAGAADGDFKPDGQVSVIQAVIMADRLHSIYHTGSAEFPTVEPWYEPYVNYGKEHGIITAVTNPYAPATRAYVVDILSRALPAGELEPINEIVDNAIPDVKTGDGYAESIYRLYRAGILSGSNARGAFYPANTISRAEAAVIMARMVNKSLRKSFTMEYSGPDLTPLERQDDSFFEHSAILGNSLVEGLRLFSQMRSIHYFSATSVSVVSATQTRNVRLRNGASGTLVQSLCQDQYDKIYIELGINEIGGSVDVFIRNYGNMIDSIRAAEPNADIYILSILPVTRNKSQSSTSI